MSKHHAIADSHGFLTIGLISFLSLVDLFGPQAIAPSLTKMYDVSPATMGFAINASTMGMAVAGLAIALISRALDRRLMIWVSMLILTVPTISLAFTHNITLFIILRVCQGLLMAVAFTLTMAYLAENSSTKKAAGAMAAYITGNVLSNLAGRLMSATVADYLSVESVFYMLAILNIIGALLAYFCIGRSDKDFVVEGQEEEKPELFCPKEAGRVCNKWYAHLTNPRLVASFAIGFIILFVFIGAYTYINYILAGEMFGLTASTLGLIYFVFLPSVITTPIAGAVAVKVGTRQTYWLSITVSIVGLLLLLSSNLIPVLIGLAILAIGLFFAQASVTGFVGQAAKHDRASASGLYLSSYYFGGLMGALIVGRVFVNFGWSPAIQFMIALLAISSIVALLLKLDKS